MTFQTVSPYGDARFARLEEVRRAGLLKPGGVEFGLVNGQPLRHSNRAGIKITGGAGCGKSSQVAVPMILGSDQTIVLIDSKGGEITQVIEPHCALKGIPLYVVDPFRVTGARSLRVSLLSHLKAGSPTLVPDSQRFWMSVLPDSRGDTPFFEQAGRRFGDAITRHDVHLNRSTSFQSIFDLISLMRADFESWSSWAELAKERSTPDIVSTFGEMKEMYAGSPKTFDSVMGGVSNAWTCMSSPAAQDTFVSDVAADFGLEELLRPGKKIATLVISEELMGPMAPVVRTFVSSIRTLKARCPDAPPITFLIDEAARLGRFGELADLFAIGRGQGTTPVVFYQADRQIEENLGATGRGVIEANAALMLDLGGGIRDYETARNRSLALGYQTAQVADPLIQTRAESQASEIIRQVHLEGSDPIEAGLRLRQLDYETAHTTKMRKALMEPDQLLGLDAGKMLVQARGYHLNPFIAEKKSYYLQRRFAGHYFPNPNEERELDRVSVVTWLGRRRRRIIEEPCPSFLAHLPQYADGRPLRFVEGFKPKA
jgi:type IV secretion system protein VirD4